MKIQSPWMGRVRGSAGNMTGCKIYDKNVMRAKAFEVSNPNTSAQQVRREFFSTALKVTSSVSEEQLRSLFGQKPKTMSRRNALTKQLMDACFAPPQYLKFGNNTIKFNGPSEMLIDEALGIFQPSNGDYIEDANGYQNVYSDGAWDDDLMTLVPGQEYVYNSVSNEPTMISGSIDYFDFTQLQAIGNGSKVNSPICKVVEGHIYDVRVITHDMLNLPDSSNANLIFVGFDADNKRITITQRDETVNDEMTPSDFSGDTFGITNGYIYVTCAESGENVFGRDFGSFIIKTRAEKVGRLAPRIEVIS